MRPCILLLLTFCLFGFTNCENDDVASTTIATSDITFSITTSRTSRQHISTDGIENSDDSVSIEVRLGTPDSVVNVNDIKLMQGDSLALYVDGHAIELETGANDDGSRVYNYNASLDNVSIDAEVDVRIEFNRAISDNRFIEFTIVKSPELLAPVTPLLDYQPLDEDLYVSWLADELPWVSVSLAQAGYSFLRSYDRVSDTTELVFESKDVASHYPEDCSCRLTPLSVLLTSASNPVASSTDMQNYLIEAWHYRTVSLQFSEDAE